MRFALHFAAWWIIFSWVTLAFSKWQSDNWCELPGWLGPAIHHPAACPYRGKVVVRPL